jgi:hypothetical protein
VRVFLHTIRYGIEQNFEYHGNDYYYDAANGVLNVYSPVEEDGRVALMAIVTICAGDRLLITGCDADCEMHHVREQGVADSLHAQRRQNLESLTTGAERILDAVAVAEKFAGLRACV